MPTRQNNQFFSQYRARQMAIIYVYFPSRNVWATSVFASQFYNFAYVEAARKHFIRQDFCKY